MVANLSRPRGRKLARRLAFWVALGWLVVIVPTGLFGLSAVAQNYRQEAVERAAATLAALASPTALTLADYAVERLHNIVSDAVVPTDSEIRLLQVAVIDAEGRVAASSTDHLQLPQIGAHHPALLQRFAMQAQASRQPVWQRLPATDEEAPLLVSMPAVSGLRWGTLIGHFDLRALERRLFESLLFLLAATLAVAVLLAGVVYATLTRLAVRPLEHLSRVASAVQLGQREQRLGWDRDDELGTVASSFDHMVDALEAHAGELERKVAERSAEVQAKNRDLHAMNQRLQLAVAELDRIAHLDPLTQVANRRSLGDALQLVSQRPDRPWAVLMCDLDHFKRINDSFGHAVGDLVLRELAQVLRDGLRGADQLIRYGGEEFLALLPNTSDLRAIDVAERLRRAVASCDFEAACGAAVGPLTISIGVASSPTDSTDTENIMKYADRAMYAAKAEGRNRVVRWEKFMVATTRETPAESQAPAERA